MSKHVLSPSFNAWMQTYHLDGRLIALDNLINKVITGPGVSSEPLFGFCYHLKKQPMTSNAD
jgi:hypothetical protein